METNEKQIVRVLNNILERIDTLEIQQARNKEFAAVVKKRLLDLNEFVNDVLDIVEGTNFEDDLVLEQKLTKYADLRKMVEKEIEEQDFDLELVNSIVGES
jgi:cell fate regulator YaaT (PSP1 superfamily)|tara:strand:+ start:329 stop:631 length:303 start_codon:yes stop_codon:yes gene_type:complete